MFNLYPSRLNGSDPIVRAQNEGNRARKRPISKATMPPTKVAKTSLNETSVSNSRDEESPSEELGKEKSC